MQEYHSFKASWPLSYVAYIWRDTCNVCQVLAADDLLGVNRGRCICNKRRVADYANIVRLVGRNITKYDASI
eukprot:scaffold52993_cov32-Prasinocladus_malaysianus.AAC.1